MPSSAVGKAVDGSAIAMSTPMARSPRLLPHGRLVVLLGALSAFGPLSMDMYLPGLPSMARDLSAPAWAAQLTITTSMLGLACGQLVAGPLSDALGRRRPLLTGVAAYMVASLLCARLPPSGCCSPSGWSRAWPERPDRHRARDRARPAQGVAAARFFALLMLVGGLAPILAPLVGGALLHVTDWRGIFVVLAGIGAVLLLAAWAMLAETLRRTARHAGGLVATLHVFRGLVRDRPFMGYTLSAGLTFARDGRPTSRVAVRAAGHPRRLAAALQRALRAQRRRDHARQPDQPLARGPLRPARDAHGRRLRSAWWAASACSSRCVADLGLAGLLPSLFVMVSSVGVVLPNAAALALADHPRTAGSASALLGVTQFATGALAAPLAGVGGSQTALPMAIVMATLPLAGLACLRVMAGPSAARLAPLDAKVAAHRARFMRGCRENRHVRSWVGRQGRNHPRSVQGRLDVYRTHVRESGRRIALLVS